MPLALASRGSHDGGGGGSGGSVAACVGAPAAIGNPSRSSAVAQSRGRAVALANAGAETRGAKEYGGARRGVWRSDTGESGVPRRGEGVMQAPGAVTSPNGRVPESNCNGGRSLGISRRAHFRLAPVSPFGLHTPVVALYLTCNAFFPAPDSTHAQDTFLPPTASPSSPLEATLAERAAPRSSGGGTAGRRPAAS